VNLLFTLFEFQRRLSARCDADANMTWHPVEAPFADMQLLYLKERVGYGFALRSALDLVQTKYILVLQHDRSFIRGPVPASRILAAMDASAGWTRPSFNAICPIGFPGPAGGTVQWKETSSLSDTGQVLNSVALLTRSTLNHLGRTAGRPSARGLRADAERLVRAPPELDVDGRAGKLVPLLQFYDSTHFALTQWYRNFAFDPKKRLVRKHGFVEDLMSVKLIHMCKNRGLIEGHKHFGCYLFDDVESYAGKNDDTCEKKKAFRSIGGMVGHIDGGSFVVEEVKERLRRGKECSHSLLSGCASVPRIAPATSQKYANLELGSA
jgi:hypothetical protein